MTDQSFMKLALTNIRFRWLTRLRSVYTSSKMSHAMRWLGQAFKKSSTLPVSTVIAKWRCLTAGELPSTHMSWRSPSLASGWNLTMGTQICLAVPTPWASVTVVWMRRSDYTGECKTDLSFCTCTYVARSRKDLLLFLWRISIRV